jgi:hypothetical protein
MPKGTGKYVNGCPESMRMCSAILDVYRFECDLFHGGDQFLGDEFVLDLGSLQRRGFGDS